MTPRSERARQLEGLLVVDKPAGMTSHDVVDRVRRLSGQRRVGHAGTLDPLATGVLVLGLGRATRVLEYLIGHDKRYLATIRLGITTDTYDAEGRVVSQHEGSWPLREDVERVLARFRGEIEQRPPPFSAIKQGGERLYKKARRGEAVEAPPRRVVIRDLRLLEYDPPFLRVDVTCSKGTYIRSLAHDVGQALGTGAHLAELRRLASGPFTVEQAHTLDELEQAAREGRLAQLLLPPDAGLVDLPAISVTLEEARRLAHGQRIVSSAPADVKPPARAMYDGRLVAVVEYDAERGEWQPRKVFVSPRELD